MTKVFIYTLSDKTGIRYVGKTNNIKRRLYNHISDIKKYNNHKVNWLKSLLENNEYPTIEILDIVNSEDWIFWEMYWISQIKSWGFNLVNGTNGDENPPSFKNKTHSDEYKSIRRDLMLSDKNPSKNMNDLWRKNISKSLKGRFLSPNNIEKLKKKIIQLDLQNNIIKEWNSISDAHRELNINIGNIGLCINGLRKTAGGFKWKENK